MGLCAVAAQGRPGRGILVDSGGEWLPERLLLWVEPAVTPESSEPICPPDVSGDCLSAGNPPGNPPLARNYLPFKLNIGGHLFDRFWVNENGFVTLGPSLPSQDAAPVVHNRTASALSELRASIIAPFYADAFADPLDGIDKDDVTVSATDRTLECDGNSADPCEDGLEPGDTLPPLNQGTVNDYRKAVRVIWGSRGSNPLDDSLAGIAQSDINNPTVPPDLTDPTTPRNYFQMLLIDRSDEAGGAPGDFDLLFNYDRIDWQQEATATQGPTLVGVAAGPVVVDLNKYYGGKFKTGVIGRIDQNDDTEICEPYDIPVAAAGYFNPANNRPFACNNIEIAFRNGEPALVGYTAKLELTATAPTGTTHTGVRHPTTWTVKNNGPNTATQTNVTLTLPASLTYVAGSATNATCAAGATANTLSCSVSDIASGNSVPITVEVVSSTALTPMRISATATAHQFLPPTDKNVASMDMTLQPNADLAVTACTAPASVQTGSDITVSCHITNSGPQAGSDVKLNVTLPSTLTFTSGTGCAITGGTLVCTQGNLATNGAADLTFQVRGASAGSGAISASVSGGPADAVPTNNSAQTSAISVTSPAPPPAPPSSGGGGGGGGALSLGWLLGLASIATALIARRRARLAMS